MFPEEPPATKILFPNSEPLKCSVVGEVTLSKDDPLSVDLTMFPETPTATKLLFPKVTSWNCPVVGEVTLSKDDPLSVDLKMFPELPAATNTPGEVSTVKKVIARVLLAFPAESVTINVQLE
jgi:hypothetical protein